MDELIARLESETGADRGLDGPLAVLAGWEWHGDGEPLTHEKWAGHWVIPGHPNNGTFTPERLCACTMITAEQGNTREPPHFTASVDAALSLVPAGWRRGFRDHDSIEGHGCHAWLCSADYSVICWTAGNVTKTDVTAGERVTGDAPTLALAICIAALKARAHDLQKEMP